MCEHKNNRIIKTTGQCYIYQCFDCGEKYRVEKVVEKKKSLIKRLFGG
jgi:uncharacterized Zn finger protein